MGVAQLAHTGHAVHRASCANRLLPTACCPALVFRLQGRAAALIHCGSKKPRGFLLCHLRAWPDSVQTRPAFTRNSPQRPRPPPRSVITSPVSVQQKKHCHVRNGTDKAASSQCLATVALVAECPEHFSNQRTVELLAPCVHDYLWNETIFPESRSLLAEVHPELLVIADDR
ncbi:hypothetical protein DPEC_G00340840 [Dallia pectoralis]|uniref:Uncharacterized protein n=1 Tax=Dallia pectoralis TaxID=75939 RepID=A0ACC2F588_DALPE|nr:hypothetical protein DPEC_G00340840 [Dallia pectoralis]